MKENHHNMPAPILLFVYNRVSHLSQTLEALQANHLASESDLIVYSDAATKLEDIPKVEAVRKLLRSISGFKTIVIHEREINVGLAKNIIEGVTEVVNRYGRVIVLEDDLVTSPYFLEFMNQGLALYANDNRVMNIQAHVLHTKLKMPETFFISYTNSWGWATWKRAWSYFESDGQTLLNQLEIERRTKEFDFNDQYPFTRMLRRQINGQNHSWAIRWNASVFLHHGLSLNAGRSLVKNIGTDGSGTNFTRAAGFYTVLDCSSPIRIDPQLAVRQNEEARVAIGKRFAHEYSKITKGKRLLIAIFHKLIAVKPPFLKQ